MSTIHRVVINTSLSAGAIYSYERSGRIFNSLTSLRLSPATGQEVHVYRVSRADGDFLSMTAPATLKVSYKDPDTGQLVEIESVTANSFSTDHFVFALTEDYADYNGKDLSFEFSESTTLAIAADRETITVYANRNSTGAPDRGSYCVISATVTNSSNKRVIFRSSNISIARVEQAAQGVFYGTGRDPQDGEWCIITGTNPGKCSIDCIAEADESQVDSIEVTVLPPAVEEMPGQTDSALGTELAALIDGIFVGVSSAVSLYGMGPAVGTLIDERQIVVPGSEDDLFKCVIDYSGTVPKWNNGADDDALCLFIGVIGRGSCGTAAAALGGFDTRTALEKTVAGGLGLDSARVLNATGSGTAALSASITFFVRGQDIISFGFARADAGALTGGGEEIPAGAYTCEFNANTITHYPPQTAPA